MGDIQTTQHYHVSVTSPSITVLPPIALSQDSFCQYQGGLWPEKMINSQSIVPQTTGAQEWHIVSLLGDVISPTTSLWRLIYVFW